MITPTAKSDGTVDLLGKQGTTWLTYIKVFSDKAKTVPVDLSGYGARGQVRKSAKSAAILIRLTCTVLPYHATTNPNTNIISISALASQSSAVKAGNAVYDIEIFKGAEVERVVQGKLINEAEVTR